MRRATKILGFGAVGREFLTRAELCFPDERFEVYARDARARAAAAERFANAVFRASEDFLPQAGDLTFFACSTDEEAVLRESSQPGARVVVARANMEILAQFVERGAFAQGTFLMVTNPSDLLAEWAARVSGNPRVFAVGLSVDHRRYREIFRRKAEMGEIGSAFELTGNHWDHPIPVFDRVSMGGKANSPLVEARQLRELHEELRKTIASEFNGFKPPVRSGAEAMLDCIEARRASLPVRVSGKAFGLRNFLGGLLWPATGRFQPVLPTGGVAEAALERTMAKHRAALAGLPSFASRESRIS